MEGTSLHNKIFTEQYSWATRAPTGFQLPLDNPRRFILLPDHGVLYRRINH